MKTQSVVLSSVKLMEICKTLRRTEHTNRYFVKWSVLTYKAKEKFYAS